MLTGFEKLTPNIKQKEIDLAEIIANNINEKCVGKDKAISNKRIRAAILKKYGKKVSDIRVRKMINHIRAFNLVPCLCANSKGYFKAANEDEWTAWKESMQQRINEMQNILDCVSYFNDGKETL